MYYLMNDFILENLIIFFLKIFLSKTLNKNNFCPTNMKMIIFSHQITLNNLYFIIFWYNGMILGAMDPSILATMDRDALKKQIENMRYQASMERWPLSKSIAA